MTINSNQVLIRRSSDGKWLRFQEPVEIVQTSEPGRVPPSLDYIERRVEKEKVYAAGFLSYEAGAAFDPAFKFRRANIRDDFPLLWFGLFKSVLPLESLPHHGKACWAPDWRSSVTEREYKKALGLIKDHIRRGATYQVNYTFRLRTGWRGGDAWEFFCRLLAGRNIPYAAFIESEKFAVCSFSPELFFELDGAEIVSRPMKGTMPRGLTAVDDELAARRLYLSEKDRAENVMIVDMVRNDLGRIALADSVRLVSLYDVEKHDAVWQMTSTVRARTSAALPEIFRALFPPASVTGAPKVKTMGIIAELETSPRRIYTGSIGFFAPGRKAQFNVAIRTLLIDKQRAEAEYGTGGGIVWDSIDENERRECVWKTKILSEQHGEFYLLETLLWTPEEKYFLLDLHLERLKSSANYFSFKYDEAAVRQRLVALSAAFPARPDGDGTPLSRFPAAGGCACSAPRPEVRPPPAKTRARPRRVRLLLARDGTMSCEAEIFEPGGDARVLRACLAKRSIASDNPFLYHKTTNRIVYDAARAESGGCDEVILWNEKGEVTEFCAGNIVVNLGGRMVTPPVKCGLLAGTYRAWLLANGRVAEEIVKKEDLAGAREIYFCNSVRKLRRVKLEIGN